MAISLARRMASGCSTLAVGEEETFASGCNAAAEVRQRLVNKVNLSLSYVLIFSSTGLQHYVGVDIAKGALDDFVGRVEAISKESGRSGIFSVVHCLVAADLGAKDISLHSSPLQTYFSSTRSWSTSIPLPLSEATTNARFDVASCQFAMHYMFETRERAGRFFDEISTNLKPGGYFIATTMDSRVVADWALQKMTQAVKTRIAEPSGFEELCIYADTVENSLLADSQGHSDGGDLMVRMKFETSQWNRLVRRLESSRGNGILNDDGFGVRYTFTLYDNPPSGESGAASAVDAPEWLVPLGQPLEELAKEHGMRVALCMNFHDFITQNMRRYDMM